MCLACSWKHSWVYAVLTAKVSSQSGDQRTSCMKLSRGFPLKWKENPSGLLVSNSRLIWPSLFCLGCILAQKLPVAESSVSIFLAAICVGPFIQVHLVNQKACACWKCVTRLNSALERVLKALHDGKTSFLCCVSFAGLADSSVCQSRGRTACWNWLEKHEEHSLWVFSYCPSS